MVTSSETIKPRDRRLAIALSILVFGMIGMSFAAVPLYNLFCKATGFAGTTQVASSNQTRLGQTTITVRFDSNVSGGLGWQFAPEEPNVSVKTGETRTVTYRIRNETARETVGIASFNVTPEVAGAYFNKIQCFCFTEQVLKPGEAREENVVFFIDPAIEKDPDFARLGTITLSYTFFPAKKPIATIITPAAAQAVKSGNS